MIPIGLKAISIEKLNKHLDLKLRQNKYRLIDLNIIMLIGNLIIMYYLIDLLFILSVVVFVYNRVRDN